MASAVAGDFDDSFFQQLFHWRVLSRFGRNLAGIAWPQAQHLAAGQFYGYWALGFVDDVHASPL